MTDFATELSRFDEVALLDIYPARELPIKGVSSEVLLEKIAIKEKAIVSKENLQKTVDESIHKIVVFMGAGDIGVEVLKITKELANAN